MNVWVRVCGYDKCMLLSLEVRLAYSLESIVVRFVVPFQSRKLHSEPKYSTLAAEVRVRME